MKLKTGLEYKDAGNALFLEGKIDEALKEYNMACVYLAGLDRNTFGSALGDPPGTVYGEGGQITEDKRHLSLVKANMAACYTKLQNYDRAIQCANDTLTIDPKHFKAAFRRVQALRMKGDLTKAKENCEPLKKKFPDDKSVLSEWELINNQMKATKGAKK